MENLEIDHLDKKKGAHRYSSRLSEIPASIEDTQLSKALIIRIVLKHLYESSKSMQQLEERIKLPFVVLEAIIAELRKEQLLATQLGQQQDITYQLTDRGIQETLKIYKQCGYIGPAPISLTHYLQLCEMQTVRNFSTDMEALKSVLKEAVVEERILHSLGPAITSGKSMFVYGDSGSGKTYITQQLVNLFDDAYYIPYAIAIDEHILPIYDPMVHKPYDTPSSDKLMSKLFSKKDDQRMVKCRRPAVCVGGEMTMDMLNVQFDAQTRIYKAPLQLKANGGMLIIDDFGRQTAPPDQILNRWIVPMEERVDFLSIGNGQTFSVPFDQLLVFSSNIHPGDLTDDAFLRRLGYKIHFTSITETHFKSIWQKECRKAGIESEENCPVYNHLVENLYKGNQKGYLPCHPRDLIGMSISQAKFVKDNEILSIDRINWAWETYFVNCDND